MKKKRINLKTEIIDIAQNRQLALRKSKEILLAGGIIIFPTETVYGIGCDLFNKSAAKKIFELKQRDDSKPLAAYLDVPEKAGLIATDIPESYYKLANKFLPGPLTIILKAKPGIAENINSKTNTVAIRIPAYDFLLQLLSQYANPIAGTSANISGAESCTFFEDALKPFDGKIELALKDDETKKSGIASTVISLADEKPRIIRMGQIKKEEIEEYINLKFD